MIEDVAVTDPDVVKAAPTLIPFPPAVLLLPPTQLEKTTGPLPVKAVLKVTPWLVCPEPPVQVEKVTVPVVPGVQAAATAMPCAPVAVVDVPIPETVIDPDVLSITPTALPWM